MWTRVAGVTYQNEDGTSRKDIIAGLSSGDKLRLEREPDNKYDPNAVKVCALCGDTWKQIGYLPKDVAGEVSTALEAGQKYSVILEDFGVSNDIPYCEILVSQIFKQPYKPPFVYKITKPKVKPNSTSSPAITRGHLSSVAPPPGRRYRGYKRRWEHDPNFDPRGGQGLGWIIGIVFLLLFYILPMIFWGKPIFD